MVFDDFQKKDSVIVVYTGDGKGKTSASLGLMTRALGTGWKVAFIQFIKLWEVGEHRFIQSIMPIYNNKITFYKGGLGFFQAGELSSKSSREDHMKEAKKTFDFALKAVKSGDYQLVICDEINNAVHDGLLDIDCLKQLIGEKHSNTSLCLTGRNFPDSLFDSVDIVTDMTKVKHHFDDKMLANEGIDY
ncbi:MAG: cob(I)alamin adenosyltransferase [Patescibacteria group bacterium]|nr:cob(I)alamin adenosyltransferase [Patescibacteria group bacterium]